MISVNSNVPATSSSNGVVARGDLNNTTQESEDNMATVTSENPAKSDSPEPPIDKNTLIARVAASAGPQASDLVLRLHDWAIQHADGVTFGANSYSIRTSSKTGTRTVFSCSDTGEFSLWDGSLSVFPPFDQAEQRNYLRTRLLSVPGAIKDPSRKSIGIKLGETASQGGAKDLIETLEWFLTQTANAAS